MEVSCMSYSFSYHIARLCFGPHGRPNIRANVTNPYGHLDGFPVGEKVNVCSMKGKFIGLLTWYMSGKLF